MPHVCCHIANENGFSQQRGELGIELLAEIGGDRGGDLEHRLERHARRARQVPCQRTKELRSPVQHERDGEHER